MCVPKILRQVQPNTECLFHNVSHMFWFYSISPVFQHPCTHTRVALRIERRAETINRFRSGREGLKAREILERYPQEKAEKLMKTLRSKNLFYYDEDFPNDEEDRGSESTTATHEHCVGYHLKHWL